MDFLIGGVAAMGAGVFTNPLELVKIRMQLQGELQAPGKHPVYYKNVPHAFYTIARADGIKALQNGLVPALWVQLFLNGFRLGTYQFCYAHGFITDKNGKQVFYKSVVASCVGAVLGAITSSPLCLVKTHLQSRSSQSVAVGYQHKTEGTFNALRIIYKREGIKGLFRGVGAAIPRAGFGGTTQLVTFSMTKEAMETREIFKNYPFLQTFYASMVSGVAISLVMTPFDVLSIRLYNQGLDASGKGIYYNGYFDSVIKIWKTEGFRGFYKGLGPSYLRLGPHSVLTLMFWDKLKRLHNIQIDDGQKEEKKRNVVRSQVLYQSSIT